MTPKNITHVIALSDLLWQCHICRDIDGAPSYAYVTPDNELKNVCLEHAIERQFKGVFKTDVLYLNCGDRDICTGDVCDGDFIITYAALTRDLKLVMICEAAIFNDDHIRQCVPQAVLAP